MVKFTDSTVSALMEQRFGHDMIISLATLGSDMKPVVRCVDGLYEDGSFYVVTYTLSSKMEQIAANNAVAICGEWFTARGTGENLGHILAPENASLAEKLNTAFAAWIGNGDVDESDPNTCILRIRLESGILFAQGARYEIDFT